MWRALGSLSQEGYDRKYSDRELIKRMLPYLIKLKKYLLISMLFSLLRAIVSLISPILFAVVFDELQKNGFNADLGIVGPYSTIYLIFLVVEWIFDYISQVNKQKLNSGAMYELRYDLFQKINQHELSFFDRNKTGMIMSRIQGDAFNVGSVLSTFVDIAQVIFYAVFILSAMFLINWQISLLACIVFPLLFFSIFLASKYLRRYTILQRRAEAAVNSATEEFIRGIQITKSFGQEKTVLNHYKELQKTKVKVISRRMFVFRSFPALIDFFTAIALYIILLSGGSSAIQGIFTPGMLYLFITYFRRLFAPIVQLGTFYATLQGGFASAERMFSLMDVPMKITEGIRECPPLKGEIEFKDVTFYYSKSKGPVLEKLSLKIPQGQTLAIVGETGAGKTSIASLLARFYEYQQGDVLIDGNDLKEITPDSLRDQLGYVLQEPFLFTGTIRENLLLGSPSATDEDIKWAIEAVKADSFIDMLPEKTNTEVRERGRNLSQGQRQLLSLARILLKDPAILILDEATASVDAYTEKMIQDALNIVFKDRTTIVIAHRLSTILTADRILVVDKGKIVEEGTHDELIKKAGLYRELYQNYYAHQGALEELVMDA